MSEASQTVLAVEWCFRYDFQDSRRSKFAALGTVLARPSCLCMVQVLFPVLGAADDGGCCLYTLPAAWTVVLPVLFICIAFPRQASLPQARRSL